MSNWFTVKVKYTKQLDNGALKRVSEPYLLSAMTFTDAEASIYEELGTAIRGEFNVTGITRTELHDIFAYDDTGVWYKCKVIYDNLDADTEKTKKVSQNFLVEASSVKEAYERLTDNLKGMLVEFQIPSVMVSPIVEIFSNGEEHDNGVPTQTEDKDTVVSVTELEDNENKNAVYTAPGTGADDQKIEDIESEVEDNFD
jgi:hypothetical protein